MTNHIPTLGTCQNLKAAGFPQETLHVYAEASTGIKVVTRTINGHLQQLCAAPLLTEILEQLPMMDDSNDHLQLTKGQSLYGIGYSVDQEDENPAEAAALLWLELKEQS